MPMHMRHAVIEMIGRKREHDVQIEVEKMKFMRKLWTGK